MIISLQSLIYDVFFSIPEFSTSIMFKRQGKLSLREAHYNLEIICKFKQNFSKSAADVLYQIYLQIRRCALTIITDLPLEDVIASRNTSRSNRQDRACRCGCQLLLKRRG